jgi:HTH-type transcriptional regulator/antitoxin HigA
MTNNDKKGKEIKGYKSPYLIHPCETIKEGMDFLGIKQCELAKRTGLSEKHISQLLNGLVPVTIETAKIIEKVLGISAILLLNMQSQYDLDKINRNKNKRIKMFNIKNEIESIISSNINSYTTFVDDKGHNRYKEFVNQLAKLCEVNTTRYLSALVNVREDKYGKKSKAIKTVNIKRDKPRKTK